ncbi:MAG: DUF389 domain-containing protein [Candidatus Paceibacterota bacterium]
MEIKPLFLTTIFQQKRTLDLLLEESKTSSSFYLFLVASAFLTTLGLLLNNPVIIIGGMLVAPLLFPVFLVGMGVSISSRSIIKRAGIVIIKSVTIIIGVSFVTAFLLDTREITEQIAYATNANLLYALAAFAAGVVGAFSWAKQNILTNIPAIAITVALIPPLASTGIALSLFSREVLAGGITLFLINIVGIVAAAVIVFSLFGYSRIQKVAEQKVKTEEQKEKNQEAEEQKEKNQ